MTLFFFTWPIPSAIIKFNNDNPLNIKPIANTCNATFAIKNFEPNNKSIISSGNITKTNPAGKKKKTTSKKKKTTGKRKKTTPKKKPPPKRKTASKKKKTNSKN